LYVAAYDDAEFLPGDNFNGITVSSSRRFNDASTGQYREVDPTLTFDNDADGDRTSIDILAPGVKLTVASLNNQSLENSGTSFAAPHAVGTVALLQQYADQQIALSNPRFTDNSHQHQVMKAVLLNSADKIKGVHGSTRTVLDQNRNNWLQLPAHSDPFMSLDQQMGAGHLNARRAHVQFKTGEYNPGTVPLIGWDYDSIGAIGSDVNYLFNQPLVAGQYIAITLAWDRRVEKNLPDNTYTYGDIFFSYNDLSEVLTDLDLYLMPANSNDLLQAVDYSLTSDDNLEHIFFQIPTTGDYKITVHNNGGLSEPEDFGLAWWYGTPSELITPGDFDKDGDVDDDDLSQWEGDYGNNGDSDADGDGDSDGDDFLKWQQNFGTGVELVAASTAVPEPASYLLLILGLVFSGRARV
jgi:hypothetical protein